MTDKSDGDGSTKSTGLNLNKLLKKKVDSETTPALPTPSETAAPSEPARAPSGLGKLLSKAKAKATEMEAPPANSVLQPSVPAPAAAPASAPTRPPAASVAPTARKDAAEESQHGHELGHAGLQALFSAPPASAAPARAANKPSAAPAQSAIKPTTKPTAKPAALAPENPPNRSPEKPSSKLSPVGPTSARAMASARGDTAAASAATSGDGVDKALSDSVTPFVSSVEQTVSQQGAKGLRLDVTVATERRYPLGFFGVDEIMMAAATYLGLIRGNIWRTAHKYPSGVVVAFRVIGGAFYHFGMSWKPGDIDITEHQGALPAEPLLTITVDADTLIDNVRGKQMCEEQKDSGKYRFEGDTELLFWLGIDRRASMTDETIEALRNAERGYMTEWGKRSESASDPIDAFSKFVQLGCEQTARLLTDPVFVRAHFDSAVEVLYHFENKRLTVLRGKPGETLLPGAAEIFVNTAALRAISERECNLFFLIRSGQVRIEGDPDALREVGLFAHPDTISEVRRVMKTGDKWDISKRPPQKVATSNGRPPWDFGVG